MSKSKKQDLTPNHSITQKDFTEYPAFYYQARNLLTSKEKEFLITVLR